MLCENCNTNEATVHFTEIRNGVQTEHHLCSECATKMEVPGYLDGMNNEFPFVQILTGLLAAGGMAARQDTTLQHVVCPKCGMNFQEFTRVGKFGCAECYHVFGPLIDDNLKCIHGDNVHCGKEYVSNRKEEESSGKGSGQEKQQFAMEQQMEELHLKLKEAVEIENFEEAARLRDEIRALSKGGGGNA